MVRIATVTVAIGMAVMILSMAVIGGFKRELTDKLVGFASNVQIVGLYNNNTFASSPILRNDTLVQQLSQLKNFSHVQQFATTSGIIKTRDAIHGVVLKGVGKDFDSLFLSGHLVAGRLPEVGAQPRKKDILLSQAVADMLFLNVGDKIEMVFVGNDNGVRRDRFKISGFYSSGLEEMDKMTAVTDIGNVQRILGWESDQIGGYEVFCNSFNRMEEFSIDVYRLVYRMAPTSTDVLRVNDIKSLYPTVFDWLDAHNVNGTVIIVIMMLVAALNMISALLIILFENTRTIGILKALGMTSTSIRHIFLLRSARIILVGMAWGNLVGIGVALIQKYTALVRLDNAGYMLSSVPIALDWKWLMALDVASPLVLLAVMTVPVMIVSRIKPDKTMRYQ